MRKDDAGMQQVGRIIKEHKAIYPDPITMHMGDVIDVSDKEDTWNGWIWIWCINQQGKSGWVPKSYVEYRDGIWKARYDYTALELSVSIGEIVTVMQEESGWLWCINQSGEKGWVPAESVVAC